MCLVFGPDVSRHLEVCTEEMKAINQPAHTLIHGFDGVNVKLTSRHGVHHILMQHQMLHI